MEFSSRETWTVIHGLVLGTLFLLAFAGGLAGLWSMRPGLMTTEGIKERMGRLYVGAWVMAAAAWGAVITGTWIVPGQTGAGWRGRLRGMRRCDPAERGVLAERLLEVERER